MRIPRPWRLAAISTAIHDKILQTGAQKRCFWSPLRSFAVCWRETPGMVELRPGEEEAADEAVAAAKSQGNGVCITLICVLDSI